MSFRQRLAKVSDRLFDRLRHPDAFTLRFDDAVDGTFDSLRGESYAVLVTFRRSGEAVPSPVWIGLGDDDKAYVQCTIDSGKVKRLRADPRALLAPSTSRGKPTGPAVRGQARVLAEPEWPRAEAALADAYGAGRKLYVGAYGDLDGTVTYLEVTPTKGASGSSNSAQTSA